LLLREAPYIVVSITVGVCTFTDFLKKITLKFSQHNNNYLVINMPETMNWLVEKVKRKEINIEKILDGLEKSK
jgi:hypothetical protein